MSGMIRVPHFARNPELDRYTLQELVAALLRRTSDVEVDFRPLAEWSSLLSIDLERRGNVHENRLSQQRLRDLFVIFSDFVGAENIDFRGMTVVELGCGGLNPLSQLLIFVMLGAERAIGVDVDSIQDPENAALALARTAAWMLTDPSSIVGGRSLEPTEMMENLRGINLSALARGDLGGLQNGPLRFMQNSLYEMALEAASTDLVISNAFLEHLPDCERAIECIGRLTRSGGYSIHSIDGFDHDHYVDGRHPLDFLKLESTERLFGTGGCNRVRPLEFVPLFRRSGFDILEVKRWSNGLIDLGTIDRDQLAAPFRDLPDEVLEVGRAGIYCRKTLAGG